MNFFAVVFLCLFLNLIIKYLADFGQHLTFLSLFVTGLCVKFTIKSKKNKTKANSLCRDYIVVRACASHQCGVGLIPRGFICGLSLLVLHSAPRGFSSGNPVFPSP